MEEQPDIIVHLAAQAGVRYSLENPRAYVDANLVGTFKPSGMRARAGVCCSADGFDQFGLWRERGHAV